METRTTSLVNEDLLAYVSKEGFL